MSDDLDRDLKARFDRELAQVRPPATWSLAKGRSSPLGVAVAVAAVAALLVGATVGGLALRDLRESQSAAVPTASPSPSPGGTVPASPSPTPTATPASALFTHEHAVLGYRITLPEGYRVGQANVITGHDEALGGVSYTTVSEREEREQCQRDVGHVLGPSDRDPDVNVSVSRNPRGVSAADWVNTPRFPGAQPLSTHQKVEPMTLGGHEAVRLVADNATAVTNAFAIRANDRMYYLYSSRSLPSRLPKTWLDEIARTFVAIQPAPFPTPAPTTAPRVATRAVGQALADAFVARDADAVARVITPRCWLNIGSTVGSGGINRATGLFISDLRTQFGRADFKVSVDPQVQIRTHPVTRTEEYFLRSTWNESGRVTQIDLFLNEIEGRWYWTLAIHQHQGGASYSCLWAGAVAQC